MLEVVLEPMLQLPSVQVCLAQRKGGKARTVPKQTQSKVVPGPSPLPERWDQIERHMTRMFEEL
jgi:hypothetical protein